MFLSRLSQNTVLTTVTACGCIGVILLFLEAGHASEARQIPSIIPKRFQAGASEMFKKMESKDFFDVIGNHGVPIAFERAMAPYYGHHWFAGDEIVGFQRWSEAFKNLGLHINNIAYMKIEDSSFHNHNGKTGEENFMIFMWRAFQDLYTATHPVSIMDFRANYKKERLNKRKPKVHIPVPKPNLERPKTQGQRKLELRIQELEKFISVSIPRVKMATENALKETFLQLKVADPTLTERLQKDMREYASQLILLDRAQKEASLKKSSCVRMLRKTTLQREMSEIESLVNTKRKDLDGINRNLLGNYVNIEDALNRINASKVITEAEISSIVSQY